MSKVWFITGSAGGLGAGIAKAALAAGHEVVATDLDLPRLQEVTGKKKHTC
jgi:NAD(P)-dependent dehydrogenase (short-subunit alcohol dehydrogenase family)